jgi:hypothetical protein
MEHGVVELLMRDRPSFHVGGTRIWNALPGSLGLIERLVTASDRTVETGCGASTVVFAAMGAEHTVISPDAREHALVHAYCTSNGIDDSRVTYVADSSDRVLPVLCEGRELDFAFVDGAHSFPYPVVDFHYVAKHLKVGGWLLLDDIPIPAVAPAYRFMKAEAHCASSFARRHPRITTPSGSTAARTTRTPLFRSGHASASPRAHGPPAPARPHSFLDCGTCGRTSRPGGGDDGRGRPSGPKDLADVDGRSGHSRTRCGLA